MTLGTQVTYAKRRARISSSSVTESTTDDVVRIYVNDGVKEFCRRIGGLSTEEYLTVVPTFDLRTNCAIRFTITGGANAFAAHDVPLCTASIVDETGTEIATCVNAQLSNLLGVSVTLSWDSASWIFSLRDNTGGATAIEIDEPEQKTYVDWSERIFGKIGTAALTYFEGDFPLDCTVETELPSDFLQIESVFWNGVELVPAPWEMFVSPGISGTPTHYAIKNRRIRLVPCPTEQKEFLIRYKSVPSDLETDGTDDATDCPLPDHYHMIPIYWAASQLLEEHHEYDKAIQEMAYFTKAVLDYKCREDNQTPTLFPARSSWYPFKVRL